MNTGEGRDDQFSVAGVAMPMSEQVAAGGRVVRRRWGVIVFLPLLALLVSLAVGLGTAKQYTATAKLYLYPINAVGAALDPGSQVTPADPERDLNTEVSQITEAPMGERVRGTLRTPESGTDLLAQVSAQLEGTTNIVDIKAIDASPNRAAQIANAFATDYVAYGLQSERAQFEQALAALPPGQRNGSTARDLQSAIATATPDATVTQAATVPTSPSSPKTVLDAVIALIVGLLVGLLAAVGLELFDGTIRDDEEAATVSRLPSLGVIPRPRPLASASGRRARRPGRGTSARTAARGGSASSAARFESSPSRDWQLDESYVSLAVTLVAKRLGTQEDIVMVTSPGPQDGKTSVCLGLAAALTELGRRVIAVECDMRRPRFAEYLGLPANAYGLSSILTGGVEAGEGLVEVDIASSSTRAESVPFGAGRPAARRSGHSFRVLPSGPVPAAPLTLLGGPGMSALLRQLRGDADIVLLDAPSPGVIKDAVVLAAHVDQVMLVVRLGRTRRDLLRRCRAMIEQFGSPVLGIVSVGAPRGGALAYYGARHEGSSPRRGSQASAAAMRRDPPSGGNGANGGGNGAHGVGSAASQRSATRRPYDTAEFGELAGEITATVVATGVTAERARQIPGDREAVDSPEDPERKRSKRPAVKSPPRRRSSADSD